MEGMGSYFDLFFPETQTNGKYNRLIPKIDTIFIGIMAVSFQCKFL